MIDQVIFSLQHPAHNIGYGYAFDSVAAIFQFKFENTLELWKPYYRPELIYTNVA